MADTIDDGGAAFPVIAEGGSDSGLNPHFEGGMSLLDYFAAAVLPSLLPADPAERSRYVQGLSDGTVGGRIPATAAYQIATAMLAERAKRGK